MRRYAYLIAAAFFLAAIPFILLDVPVLVIGADFAAACFVVIGYRERRRTDH